MTFPLDALPIFAVLCLALAIFWFAIEAGYRVAVHGGAEREAPVRTIVGALLALLAFILAITFGAASSRLDVRKTLVVKEANAIGTAYRSADFLPASRALEVKRLLREYVNTRLEAIEPGRLQAALARSEQLQSELWEQAIGIARDAPDSAGLFIAALNIVLDVHEERVVAGIHNRIPTATWGFLFFVAVTALAAVGYELGLHRTRRPFVTTALSLAFSLVIVLIWDLDRPRSGLFRASQQAMTDLRGRVN